jgi:hypothetical protein
VGFVSSLGTAMDRSIPASLITPLAQPATPVSTNILVTLFRPDIGQTRKNMPSQHMQCGGGDGGGGCCSGGGDCGVWVVVAMY